MSPDEYQERAVALCKNTSALHLFCGLAAEAGEVCGLMQKEEYKDKALDEEQLFEELGDVLWYVANLLESFGQDLSECMKHNIEKLEERHGRSSK